MTAERPPAHSPLPAPYRNPWRLLAADMRAVVADLRLRLQELVRRNGDGSLPRPEFWPPSLAGLFWPLLLALGITLLVVLTRTWGVVDAEPSAAPAPIPTSDGLIETAPTPQATPPPPAPPPARAPTPLEQAYGVGAPQALIHAVHDDDGANQLVLVLGPGWGRMAAADRQRQADAWLQQADGLGYGQLALNDLQGRPLGHSAAVGQGMVLLQPPG
ncbi:MAG: hypothetical protein VKN13_06750 [Cyanobacteriota bacterium]|nr:hypothetical protein [Cyanobacteriota bacterium]